VSAWIWDAFHRETPNQLLLFRRMLRSAASIESAWIEVATPGSFRVWVDGEIVAHYDVQHVDALTEAVRVDLSDALAGRTRATIVVGAYSLGIGTHHQRRSLGGLWTHGAARTSDDEELSLDSSSEWQVRVPASWRQNAPQMVWSAGYAEWSDRTLDTGFDDDGWGAAVEYPGEDAPPLGERDVAERLVRLTDHVVETGTLAARAATADPDRATGCAALGAIRHEPGGDSRYVVIHLPHQLVGFLEVEVTTAIGATVDVLMGERADDTGWPTCIRQGILAVDTVVVPEGRTRHRFWHRRTFRALAIVVHGDPDAVVESSLRSITASRPHALYATDDDRSMRMHAVSAATVAVGRQDLYEDCPLREGGHYVADARIQAMFDLATTGVTATARRSVLAFAMGQDADGMIPGLWPSGTRHRIPDFALQWPCYLDEAVRFTDDDSLLDEAYPALLRLIDWADGRWTHSGFTTDEPGWWTFIDWYEFTPAELQAAVDAQYAVTLESSAALAERRRDTGLAERLRDRRDEVLARLASPVRFPHAATILLCGLPRATALPVVGPEAGSVLHEFAVETGYFAFQVFRARIALGDVEGAAALLESYWGGMLDAGAATWWERYSPRREVVESTQSSLCHPWSAGPIVALPMLALGIDPFARSESDARFAPAAGYEAAALLHTPWGVIRNTGQTFASGRDLHRGRQPNVG
jgi:hypothetical protein